MAISYFMIQGLTKFYINNQELGEGVKNFTGFD